MADSTAQITVHMDTGHIEPITSEGFADLAAALTAIMVVGINCTAAVFRTVKMHMASLAEP
jgi:hypothetical protein